MTALTKFGWLAYVVAFVGAHSGLETLFLVALILGMACHWRFWRLGLPVCIVAFIIGWHWGSRR